MPPALRSRRRPARAASVVITGGALVAVALVGIGYAIVGVPRPNALSTAQTSVFAFRDGSELGRVGAYNRISVPLARVPEHVQRAVLAAEDRDFYAEPGISLAGMARAFWTNLRGGQVQAGGSTIPQQYVKNAHLTQERTFSRKTKEIFIALKVTRRRGKRGVLEDYLNTIYFGRGAYGVQTAAQAYFGKDVSRLSVDEGALLAALIRAPAAYDPVLRPQAARARWRYVLEGMVSEGWLARSRAAQLRFPRVRNRDERNRYGGPNGHLVWAAVRELERNGITEDEVRTQGYRVTTTFDRPRQHAAVAAVRAVLSANGAEDLAAALAAVEPGTGRVLALYGGSDYAKRQFNNALDGQPQAGSSFKPFVLAAALDNGIGLRSRYDGASPLRVPGSAKPVRNFGGRSYGRLDLVSATARSVNTVYVRLGLDVGIDEVLAAAHSAGIPEDAHLPRDATAFLGSGSVAPIDAANAFATFAAQGNRASWHVVESVRDRRGEVVLTGKPRTTRAFDSDVAADVTYALRAVVREGTARVARLPGRPAAGKTGTSTDNLSAWFVGYTPQMSAAVTLWRGDGTQPMRSVAGHGEITGGSLPARIWREFMTAALEGQPVAQFPAPAWAGRDRDPPPAATGTPQSGEGATRTRRARGPWGPSSPRPSSPGPSSPGPSSPGPSAAGPSAETPPAPMPTTPASPAGTDVPRSRDAEPARAP